MRRRTGTELADPDSNARIIARGNIHKSGPGKEVIDSGQFFIELNSLIIFSIETKPFSLTLLKFSHDKYKGTEKPRNFSSLVKLRDPRNGEDSTRLIKMNEPLRYEGETFFQASFLPGDRTTILQVVKNPAAWLPYVSCVVVSLGMMLQFLVHLLRFTQKRANA